MALGYFVLFIPFVTVSILKRIVDWLYQGVERATYKCAEAID